MGSKTGIFCLEGDWDEALTSRCSVEPYLRLLEELGYRRLIHRDVATVEEFEHYLDKWLAKRYVDYVVGYFAFHGERRSICLGKEDLTLDQLGEMLAGRVEGRVLYFAACLTLNASDDELKAFCKRTGAKAVAGYTREVDWLQSAAFDFLLLPKLLNATNMKPVFTSLEREHGSFVRTLGFRMATAAWVMSPRASASTR